MLRTRQKSMAQRSKSNRKVIGQIEKLLFPLNMSKHMEGIFLIYDINVHYCRTMCRVQGRSLWLKGQGHTERSYVK